MFDAKDLGENGESKRRRCSSEVEAEIDEEWVFWVTAEPSMDIYSPRSLPANRVLLGSDHGKIDLDIMTDPMMTNWTQYWR